MKTQSTPHPTASVSCSAPFCADRELAPDQWSPRCPSLFALGPVAGFRGEIAKNIFRTDGHSPVTHEKIKVIWLCTK